MISDNEILAVVKQFVEDLGRDSSILTSSAKLNELGIDSLQAVDLVFRFEEKFHVSLPMDKFDAQTVEDAVLFVKERIASTS